MNSYIAREHQRTLMTRCTEPRDDAHELQLVNGALTGKLYSLEDYTPLAHDEHTMSRKLSHQRSLISPITRSRVTA